MRARSGHGHDLGLVARATDGKSQRVETLRVPRKFFRVHWPSVSESRRAARTGA